MLPGFGADLAAPGSPQPKLNEPMLGGPLSQCDEGTQRYCSLSRLVKAVSGYHRRGCWVYANSMRYAQSICMQLRRSMMQA